MALFIGRLQTDVKPRDLEGLNEIKRSFFFFFI